MDVSGILLEQAEKRWVQCFFQKSKGATNALPLHDVFRNGTSSKQNLEIDVGCLAVTDSNPVDENDYSYVTKFPPS